MSDAANPGGGAADNILGKKIFFLYPSAMIMNTLMQELIQQEYEVYAVKNHESMLRGLKKYPRSVVFVNINDGLDEVGWESWIRSVMETPETSETSIGILSSVNDEALRSKYVTEIGISCGFTALKSDITVAVRQILECLRIVDAKGRRKYLRAGREIGASINLPLEDGFVNGHIRDISAVGFSCVLEKNPELTRNVLLQNIQLKIQGGILKVEGIVYGSREDEGDRCYVFLFTQRVDPDTRTRIRNGIQMQLQAQMDEELK
ncbi:MAG: PilZ domain-containing protein [Treponema sp.]|jgi:hypothetical protein|nr:PilZ domain-containing protein [Treponema sp.]